jgi:sugar transferase (PEP-CTERM/EpsH1 system associated)
MTRHNPPLVAHVIYSLTTGGLENGLVNIINRTPGERYRHVIICISHADDFAERITADGVEIIALNKREGHDIGFYWRVWRLFRQLRPDIIHSRNLAALETQLLSISSWGVKRVHGEHGRGADDLDGTNWKYLTFRQLMRPLVHRYIAVSKDLEQWLVGLVQVTPAKVRQIYNGVDHQQFCPTNAVSSTLLPPEWGEQADRLVVGTVGRLTPVKDQQSLLRSVALLRETHPTLFRRIRVVLVGNGPLRQDLAKLATELELAAVTWMPGDRQDVPALLALMDVFVLPSLAEGISNTVLEAMASGLPVVATAVGGNLELVKEGVSGSLVPSRDAAALARALVPLLESRTHRAQLGSNARQFVCEGFTWQQTVAAYLGVYDELMQSKGVG